MPIHFISAGAAFDETKRYRYTLWRHWALPGKLANFVMLNPSTADEHVLDPTVTRCMNYAHDMGCSGAVITNIFAYRSTDPRLLYAQHDPIGSENDRYIQQTADACDLLIVAWGVHGELHDRGLKVAEMLAPYHPQCFGLTQRGFPRHPLYLRRDAQLMDFRISVARELATA